MEEIGRALEGHALGHYNLERFVGGGGMGAVFRAVDTTLDRVVAVKVLSRQHSSDVDTLRRFKNEAQLAARLDHENIGRVHAVGSDGGWHFIVFEYIEGTNLRDTVLGQGPLDVPSTIRFTVQVAEALEHASDRGVVHRESLLGGIAAVGLDVDRLELVLELLDRQRRTGRAGHARHHRRHHQHSTAPFHRLHSWVERAILHARH